MDFAPSTILNFKFSTILNSVPTTLAGSPEVSVYKNNSTTQSTTGVTLTVDFDSLTGMHNVNIDTSADGTFYAAGNQFQVIVTAGTVGGNSLVGFVISDFSLNFESPLRPTTAGRTLAVDGSNKAPATIAAGDIATDAITAASVKADAVTKIQTGLATPTNITGGTITTATNLTNAPTSGDFTAAMKASLNAATPAVTVSDKTGFSLSSGGVQAIWDALTSALTTAGSIGKRLVEFMTTLVYVAPDNTAISAIKAKTDNLPSDPAAESLIIAATDALAALINALPSAADNATAYNTLADGVETGITPQGAMRAILAALAGVATGGNSTTIVLKNPAGNTTRITLTVDADGNRSASVLNV